VFSSSASETYGYLELKRRIYLTIIPILIMALSGGWLLTDNAYEQFAYPPLAILLLFLWIFLLKSIYIRVCEMIILSLFSLFHLIRVFLLANLVSQGIFDLYMLWSPLYFVIVFFILDGKRALTLCLSVYVTTLTITAVNALDLQYTAKLSATILQFYVANLIYIIVLYFLQKLVSAYIESDKLKKYAYKDALTKIWNRRRLDECLKNEIELCQEANSTFSIIYFDIDHFKQINDTYGHVVGDNVLKEFATIVQSSLRETDYFGRWGGEEFLIVATNQSPEQVFHLAERLRAMIEQHSFQEVGHITASFGITSFAEKDQPTTIIWRADLALYEAKLSGRNAARVHIARECPVL
jgi:diguanylate cyclase (GGDEF)-like protein